jgi:predicted nucleotidyltransferase
VKVADEVEVDVSTHAWKVSYADAISTALEVVIDGVRVPYLSLESLIASKETYRDQDRADLVRLLAIREAKRREGGLK